VGWQPIETAPRDGRYVIVGRFGGGRDLRWVKHSRWIAASEAAGLNFEDDPEFFEDGWTDGSDEHDCCYPTHWMPLPAPPESEA
jgi:hypothetical protein